MQTLSLDQLGDEIAELSAHLDAATARLLDLIREFDARGGWNNGFSCCAAWLTWRVGLAPGAAREHVRVARALGALPLLAQALARAEVSYSKGGCRFPGSGVRFGQGHHIRHWAQGGPTTLSNLAMLCRRHHRAVHEEGYGLDRQPDGELRFRRPDGRPLPDVPSPPQVADDPVHVLRARHEAEGLVLHAHTATPGWLGEPLDVGWAIDVLHPLATRERE